MNTIWLLGLTGGIGSGKSAAADFFAARGVHVVDADAASRWVVEPGEAGLAGLIELLGDEILLANGRLDRAGLRARIFADEGLRSQVEQLLHPLIREAIARDLAGARSEYAILMSPLLIEAGQYRQVQRILVVDVPESVQLQRVLQRDGVDEAQVRAILAAQLSREERLQHADDVICNDASLAALEAQVAALHTQYLNYARGEA